jgi:virginiamycin B lyase
MSKHVFLPVMVAAFLCLALPARSQNGLPNGDGKQTVQTVCSQCHELSQVTRAGYTHEGWENVLHMMLNVGAPLPQEQIAVVTQYLATHFPEKPKPDAVVIPGSAQASIQEWPVPTPGSRTHDPLAAADGSLWYTGQFANVLGRFDPLTGHFKEYPLKTPQSGPHGLVEDTAGNIWFTANFKGYIGKLDPTTGAVTEYPLPDPAARDPHTPIFDHKGILWFTVQSANMVGRLLPQTGDVKLVTRSPR